MSDLDDLSAKIKDAYYHARDHGGTMHTAGDDAADAIIAAGWVPAAEHDALAATVQRVRALHHEGRMEFVTDQRCINEDCDHTDECPTEPLTVCSECWRNAEEADAYFGEHRCPDFVMWPCPTIRALDATATDGCVSEHSPATNPDCEMAPDDVVDGMRSRPEDEEATDV